MPAALAFLGLGFAICALVIAGMPPLSGFVGKLAMLLALLEARQSTTTGGVAEWAFFAALIVSGLLSATALLRVGIRHFWATQDRSAPRLQLIEGVPIIVLLTGGILLVVNGDAALRYAAATAAALHQPSLYIDAVMATRTVTRAARVESEAGPTVAQATTTGVK